MAIAGESKGGECNDLKLSFDSLTLVNRVSMISRPVSTNGNKF